MENKKYIYDIVNNILKPEIPNKSELVGYLRDFAYARSIDPEMVLYIINSLFPILEKTLDLSISDNENLQDGILDLYSIFSLEQGYYTEYISEKVSSLNLKNLPISCHDFIEGLMEI